MDKNIELISKTQNGNDRLLPVTDCENVLNLSAKIAHDAMPSDKFISVTLPASGSSVIAPADGYYLFKKRSNGAGQYVMLEGKESKLDVIHYLEGICRVILPVAKGQTVNIWYTAGGQLMTFRFIYAIGSVPSE